MTSKPSRRLSLILALGALALAACSGKSGGTAAQGDMSMGDANAKVKVVEYASLTCGHCARFHEDVFPAFKTKYIDTGKVQYTYKEFLTEPANVAAMGYVVARCAGADKYFTVIGGIFHNQPEMFSPTSSPREVMLRVAQSTGMTEEQFKTCLADENALKAVNDRVEKAARNDGITSTPTFFINGKKVKEGEISMAELDAAIAAASK